MYHSWRVWVWLIMQVSSTTRLYTLTSVRASSFSSSSDWTSLTSDVIWGKAREKRKIKGKQIKTIRLQIVEDETQLRGKGATDRQTERQTDTIMCTWLWANSSCDISLAFSSAKSVPSEAGEGIKTPLAWDNFSFSDYIWKGTRGFESLSRQSHLSHLFSPLNWPELPLCALPLTASPNLLIVSPYQSTTRKKPLKYSTCTTCAYTWHKNLLGKKSTNTHCTNTATQKHHRRHNVTAHFHYPQITPAVFITCLNIHCKLSQNIHTHTIYIIPHTHTHAHRHTHTHTC